MIVFCAQQTTVGNDAHTVVWYGMVPYHTSLAAATTPDPMRTAPRCAQRPGAHNAPVRTAPRCALRIAPRRASCSLSRARQKSVCPLEKDMVLIEQIICNIHMLEYICSGTTRTQPASLGNPKGEEDTNNTQRPPPSHTTAKGFVSSSCCPLALYHLPYHLPSCLPPSTLPVGCFAPPSRSLPSRRCERAPCVP